ncbi:MAG: hypothetical protein DRH04_03610 [Deltaproteobacteria bacterium]|nr:MAG: hypothetical protein DRH04_03610 [Deltaproteobacteria bacterium]
MTALLMLSGSLQAAEYVSLYTTYGRTVSYCSQTPCGGAGNCRADVVPCGGDYSYKYTDTLVGFKDMYNLNDSRILCGLEGDGCSPEEARLSLNLKDLRSSPDAFRIYLPPGTVRAVVNFYLYNGAKDIGFAVRYQQPPDCLYCQYARQQSRYDDIPWATSLVRLSDVTQGDVYTENLNGLSKILTFSSSTPLSPGAAGWLYIKKIPFTTATIRDIVVDVKVDVSAYLNWYNNGADWDAAGDPWSGNNTVAPPRVCASSNLGACLTASACGMVGAYWYDGRCNRQPACTVNDPYSCDTSEKCGDSNLYWYEGECNAEPACTVSTLTSCDTEPKCESTGFYWYDGFCNEEPRCRLDNLVGCESEVECTEINAYWYAGGCNAEPACTAGTLSSCDTVEKCTSSGFMWSAGYCIDEPLCSRSNLGGCSNESDCVAHGGEWHNYLTSSSVNCTRRSTTSGSSGGPTFPTSGPANSGSTSSGLAALFGITVSPTSNANVPPPPVGTPPCDGNHLEECDRSACEALGSGYWYDGSCHEQREYPDYRDHIVDAPVRLGSDVDDGELVAGDGLSLRINFSGESRRYVVIVFPNDDFYFIHDDNPEQLLTKQVLSLRNNGGAPLFEAADLCSVLPEYRGEWKIYFLTVPATENELRDLQALASYLDGPNAQYVLGSYSVMVDCNKRNNVSAATLLGLFQ